MNKQKVFIIIGPTASGKTAFSIDLACFIDGEIINCDIAQSYKNIPIGTAQPSSCEKAKVAHHLFGFLDSPEDHSSYAYRKEIEKKCNEILNKKKRPIIVGGASFYTYSLFFSYVAEKSEEKRKFKHSCQEITSNCWNCLAQQDEMAASKVHPNDIYRIERHIRLLESGIIPSKRKPLFDASFDYEIININSRLIDLEERIEKRCQIMIDDGWINEIKSLDNSWKNFVKTKNFLGYPALLDFIENDEKAADLASILKNISTETRQYAKRQLCFIKRMKKHLAENNVKWVDCSASFKDNKEMFNIK